MSAVNSPVHGAMRSAKNQMKILIRCSIDWPRQDINQLNAVLAEKNSVS
jgi:hypothetical protein